MCLTADGEGPGSAAIIADCTGAADQAWAVNADLTISSVPRPDLCLSLVGAATGNGTPVEVATCTGEPHQQWTRP